MKHIDLNHWEQLEKDFRAALVNSIYGTKPVFLVGTQNTQGSKNLGLFSQVFHIGASPPSLGMVVRQETVKRDTLDNIRASGYFTLNQVTSPWVEEAHFCSCRLPAEADEFDYTEFEAAYHKLPAPYVRQSPIKVGARLLSEQKLAPNDSVLLTAEVVEVIVEENLLDKSGHIRSMDGDTLGVQGLSYYVTSVPAANMSKYDCRNTAAKKESQKKRNS